VNEFKINKYLTLKIESARTNIYVAGERFIQCKSLLLDIPIKELRRLKGLESMDEITEEFELSEHKGIYIEPRTEFWAHCSNLQAWYENNYDTRLLHRNLSFPLLHSLTKAGDPLARQVFKEEIATRLDTGDNNVVSFLVNEHFVDFLDRSQYFMSILNPLEAESLLELERSTDQYFTQILDWEAFDSGVEDVEPYQQFIVEDRSVVGLLLYWYNKPVKKLPKSISSFKNLQVLHCFGDNIPSIPKDIGGLKNLKKLNLSSEILKELPDSVTSLPHLEYLNIRSPLLRSLPENIGNLKRLRLLSIGNMLAEIPSSVEKLQELNYLYLNNNLLTHLPRSILSLKVLKGLYLRKNKLEHIPDSIVKLSNLEILDITENSIKDIPKTLLKLENLNILFIDQNKLSERANNILVELKKRGVLIY